MPRVGEVPFSSERKIMTVVHEMGDGRYLVLSKGAMDHLPFAAEDEASSGAPALRRTTPLRATPFA